MPVCVVSSLAVVGLPLGSGRTSQNEIIIDDVFVFVVATRIKIAMKSNLTPLMNKY